MGVSLSIVGRFVVEECVVLGFGGQGGVCRRCAVPEGRQDAVCDRRGGIPRIHRRVSHMLHLRRRDPVTGTDVQLQLRLGKLHNPAQFCSPLRQVRFVFQGLDLVASFGIIGVHTLRGAGSECSGRATIKTSLF